MLSNSWKRWVAENKLLKISDQEIVDVLKKNGISENEAKEELRALAEHPYFQGADSFTQLLHKRHSLALIERELYKLNPKHAQIERRANVSREEFLEKYYSANRPVILTDLMKNWTAIDKWTPEYLKATCGEAMVDLQTERNKNPDYETQDGKHRRAMKFGDYVDMVETAGPTNDYYITARDQFFKNPLVLPLLNDIERFPQHLDAQSDWLFMWYGPKGTVTPLHHDPMNIMLAQIRGRKRIRLVPNTQMDLVYNHQGVYTHVNLDKPDYEKYPKLREASVMEMILEPGEVLFLPVGWWHDVQSLDISISISLMGFLYPNNYKWVNPMHTRTVEHAAKAAETKTETKPDVRADARLDDGWLAWVKENIQRGCDTVGIYEILKKNNFTVPAIRSAMGDHFPSEMADDLVVEYLPPEQYKALAEIPAARLEWKAGLTVVDNQRLQLYTLEHFLTDEECDGLIEHINKDLRPSTVTIYIEGYRTSLTSDLAVQKSDFIEEIDAKICKGLGITKSYSEGIQGQKYLVGNEFKPHTDFFEPGTEEYKVHAGKRGNRTWTFMIYLNDTPKGGGTKFVKLDKTLYPKKGTAVIWNGLHPDGSPNRDSMHWGMPVEEGEKYIITKWFRERGTGPMFYDESL